MSWEAERPCVPACRTCGAPGDVECHEECDNRDFRDAEFAAIDGEWPQR